jgi:GNAT superfamily N-acetyltransferase
MAFEKSCAVISNIAMHLAAQGIGVGRALLDFTEQQASKKNSLGCDWRRIYCLRKMFRSINISVGMWSVKTVFVSLSKTGFLTELV